MQTFGEKYQITEGESVRQNGLYVGKNVEYTVPETGEVREIFVPSNTSLLMAIERDLHKAS